jgi:hypothetical protein
MIKTSAPSLPADLTDLDAILSAAFPSDAPGAAVIAIRDRQVLLRVE